MALSDLFDVDRSGAVVLRLHAPADVEIVSGTTSRRKRARLTGITPLQLTAQLTRRLDS